MPVGSFSFLDPSLRRWHTSTLRFSPGQAQQDLPLLILCSSSRRTMAERAWRIRIPCHTLVGWGLHAGQPKLRAVRSEQKETCCREREATQGRAPVGGAAAPFRHTLSRLLVERSIPTTQNNTPNLLACLRHGHQAGQSIGCGSHHWTTIPLTSTFTMDMPSCNGRLQPQEFDGAKAAFGAACRISSGHSNRYPQIGRSLIGEGPGLRASSEDPSPSHLGSFQVAASADDWEIANAYGDIEEALPMAAQTPRKQCGTPLPTII
ncbi:hypothetical protein CPLU01_00289 [Colletotrichum plurivorum]|uniref:Uncharacterized protein n=1 Tax=Colletotrichum plurivorum TaxID=2175906 RepID=A0A8H6NS62_9PEZI|nr:hypothetical protein CPLU01_00289 [Colletotrichum plurivorum]